MTRPRLTPEQRKDWISRVRAKWAERIEAPQRAEFYQLLTESDRLIDTGWELRKKAWSLVKRPER